MDIKSALAMQTYANARPVTVPEPASSGPADAFANAATSFVDTLQTGEQTAKSAMTGSADPQALVQALTSSELAIETAVTVRDKVVEAYQEILRMPV
ncbi:MAG: flagellar hook-basal body complex protein FliE [Paracoccaceae bacterium]|nr:flagellar hook-basal body complex protein FliE [Paracoccaceae bacterium]